VSGASQAEPASSQVLSVPPLPPPREAALATHEMELARVSPAGRNVWVVALLVTVAVLGAVGSFFWLGGHLYPAGRVLTRRGSARFARTVLRRLARLL
jgi:hypothetical protein